MNNWKNHINVASSFSISKYEMEKAYRESLVEHFYGPGLKEAYITSAYLRVNKNPTPALLSLLLRGDKIFNRSYALSHSPPECIDRMEH